MKVEENCQAGIIMRVFLTFMPHSNENKICMKLEKREFPREFSLLCTHMLLSNEMKNRLRVGKICMKFD